jgi:hypothetical protein
MLNFSYLEMPQTTDSHVMTQITVNGVVNFLVLMERNKQYKTEKGKIGVQDTYQGFGKR